MTTKLTKLNALQVRALDEVFDTEYVTVTATTATFNDTPSGALWEVQLKIASLPGREHPKASLHAIKRKLRREVEARAAEAVCDNCGFRLPEGYVEDDGRFCDEACADAWHLA